MTGVKTSRRKTRTYLKATQTKFRLPLLITSETTGFHKLPPSLNKMKGRIKAKEVQTPSLL